MGRLTSLGFIYSLVVIRKLLDNEDTKHDLPINMDETSIFKMFVPRSITIKRFDCRTMNILFVTKCGQINITLRDSYNTGSVDPNFAIVDICCFVWKPCRFDIDTHMTMF